MKKTLIVLSLLASLMAGSVIAKSATSESSETSQAALPPPPPPAPAAPAAPAEQQAMTQQQEAAPAEIQTP